MKGFILFSTTAGISLIGLKGVFLTLALCALKGVFFLTTLMSFISLCTIFAKDVQQIYNWGENIMPIGLLRDLKLIQERVWGATARFKYTDEDGMPWHNEREPRILVLGIYTDPNTGNRNVAGIDLKDVVTRYGMEGLDVLRRNLPHILFTDFSDKDQGESLSDVAMNAAIENAFADGNIIMEVARPLKGADAGAPGTLGRWRYGDQDTDLSHIFNNSYRTYRMDRMGPATQSKLYDIPKDKEERLAQAYKEIERVRGEWEAMSKQEKLQALAAKADKGKATPEKPIGKEPEPEVVEPEISKPPEEPKIAPTAAGLKISPKYKRDIEIPLPTEEPEEIPMGEFETSAEEEAEHEKKLGGIQQIDDEDMENLAKLQVSKAQEQNAESPIAKRRKALLKAKQEPEPEEIEIPGEPKKKPEILKAKPKPKPKKDEDEIIEID